MTTDEALQYIQEQVQWLRENGESDMRSILSTVKHLRKRLADDPNTTLAAMQELDK